MKTFVQIFIVVSLISNFSFGQNYFLKTKSIVDNTKKGNQTKADTSKFEKYTSSPLQLAFGNGDFNGQIYSEFLTDYFESKNNKYLGHISVGSVLTNADNDSSKKINNFFNGGGNFFMRYAYVTPFGDKDGTDNFTFLNILSLRLAANLPKLKSGETALNDWNFEIAEEFTIALTTKNKKIGILLRPKVAIAFGSKSFINTILSEKVAKTANSFAYFQMNGAVKLGEKYKINVAFSPNINKSTSATFSDRKWATVGVQLEM